MEKNKNLTLEEKEIIKKFATDIQTEIAAVMEIFSHTNEYCAKTDGFISTGLDIAYRKIGEKLTEYIGEGGDEEKI